jgi:hypothetical protein
MQIVVAPDSPNTLTSDPDIHLHLPMRGGMGWALGSSPRVTIFFATLVKLVMPGLGPGIHVYA